MERGCRKADSIPGRGINRSNFTEPGSETKRWWVCSGIVTEWEGWREKLRWSFVMEEESLGLSYDTEYQKKGQTMLSVKRKKSYIKGKRFSRGNPILDRWLGKVSLIMWDLIKDLKETKEQAMGISRWRAFRVEGIVFIDTKALKLVHTWYIQGTSRKPAELEWNE